MEFIPLALAIIVLLKVEASHADGSADLDIIAANWPSIATGIVTALAIFPGLARLWLQP